MLKFLIVSSVCSGLWAIPALAQSSAPASPASPAPAAPAPNSPAPSSPAPQAAPSPAPASEPVSQTEVEKFASTVKQFQTIQQEAQQQAGQILEGEDLSVDRFNEILQTQQNPQAPQPSTAVSSQERQKFDRAVSKLDELRQSTRQRMDQALQSQGFERERFSQILAQVRQDAGLRARVQEQLKQ
jgi:Domain of unknown function (DUF4168)